jgi:hypothetical protein
MKVDVVRDESCNLNMFSTSISFSSVGLADLDVSNCVSFRHLVVLLLFHDARYALPRIIMPVAYTTLVTIGLLRWCGRLPSDADLSAHLTREPTVQVGSGIAFSTNPISHPDPHETMISWNPDDIPKDDMYFISIELHQALKSILPSLPPLSNFPDSGVFVSSSKISTGLTRSDDRSHHGL